VVSAFMTYRSRRTNSIWRGSNDYEINHHFVSFDLRPKCEINSDYFDGELEHKFVFGADYFHAQDQILSGDITLTKSQLDITKETLGVYASDNMLINKRFLLNGGIRGDWAEYVFDQFQPLPSHDTESLREIAFEAGTGYKYGEKSQIYANYARSYRYPVTDEFFQSAYESSWFGFVFLVPASLNTDLKQQVANNYEIGIKDNSLDHLKATAAYYIIETKWWFIS